MSIPVIDQLRTGKNIELLAKERGMKASFIGKRCGVCNTAVYKWFSGTNVPTVDNLLILSDLFEVPINDIIKVLGR